MKLKIHIQHLLAALNHQPLTIRQFGQARLIRRSGVTSRCSQYELVGGSEADRAAASEWVSLFAHHIVFKMADDATRRPKTVGQAASPIPRWGARRAAAANPC
jgi:hypothetical protein